MEAFRILDYELQGADAVPLADVDGLSKDIRVSLIVLVGTLDKADKGLNI